MVQEAIVERRVGATPTRGTHECTGTLLPVVELPLEVRLHASQATTRVLVATRTWQEFCAAGGMVYSAGLEPVPKGVSVRIRGGAHFIFLETLNDNIYFRKFNTYSM